MSPLTNCARIDCESGDNMSNGSFNEYQIPKSRGHKTRGRKHQHKYRKDIICPECGRNSVYRNQMGSVVSLKCLIRDCKNNWYEHIDPNDKEKSSK